MCGARSTPNEVKVDTDHLPPILELRVLPESSQGPAISQTTLLKIPPTVVWCGKISHFMGCITRLEGRPGDGNRFSARVLIENATYSFQETPTTRAPLSRVDPNLFHRNWIINIPAGSFQPTAGEPTGIMPLRLYYVIKDDNISPINQWVDYCRVQNVNEDTTEPSRPVPAPNPTHVQKKSRTSASGGGRWRQD